MCSFLGEGLKQFCLENNLDVIFWVLGKIVYRNQEKGIGWELDAGWFFSSQTFQQKSGPVRQKWL